MPRCWRARNYTCVLTCRLVDAREVSLRGCITLILRSLTNRFLETLRDILTDDVMAQDSQVCPRLHKPHRTGNAMLKIA